MLVHYFRQITMPLEVVDISGHKSSVYICPAKLMQVIETKYNVELKFTL